MGNCSRHSRRKSQLCRTTCASSANNMTKATAIVGVTCFLLLSATVFVALSDKDHSTTDIGSPSATTDLHVDKVKDAELAVATSATSATNQDPQASSAIDVYSAVYTSTSRCTGALETFKDTLGQCSNAGDYYRKITIWGEELSTGWYSDSHCLTTLTTVSPNPYDVQDYDLAQSKSSACTPYTVSSAARSVKITLDVTTYSDYASNSATNFDCTSGTCVKITNEPTNVPPSAPTNDGVIVTIYTDGSCPSDALTCYLVKVDQCYDSTVGAVGDYSHTGGSFKLTLSGTTYSYTMYKTTGCADGDIANLPPTDKPATYNGYASSPNPITGAADACTDFVISPLLQYLRVDADKAYSLKVMSSSDYVTATHTYDCTSGTCTTVTATNSAAHVSIGILSACLAVMAQWIA